jgi:hypothetical protein
MSKKKSLRVGQITFKDIFGMCISFPLGIYTLNSGTAGSYGNSINNNVIEIKNFLSVLSISTQV